MKRLGALLIAVGSLGLLASCGNDGAEEQAIGYRDDPRNNSVLDAWSRGKANYLFASAESRGAACFYHIERTTEDNITAAPALSEIFPEANLVGPGNAVSIREDQVVFYYDTLIRRKLEDFNQDMLDNARAVGECAFRTYDDLSWRYTLDWSYTPFPSLPSEPRNCSKIKNNRLFPIGHPKCFEYVEDLETGQPIPVNECVAPEVYTTLVQTCSEFDRQYERARALRRENRRLALINACQNYHRERSRPEFYEGRLENLTLDYRRRQRLLTREIRRANGTGAGFVDVNTLQSANRALINEMRFDVGEMTDDIRFSTGRPCTPAGALRPR